MARKKTAEGDRQEQPGASSAPENQGGQQDQPGLSSIPEEDAPNFEDMAASEEAPASGGVPSLDDMPGDGTEGDIDISAVAGKGADGKDPVKALEEERDSLKDQLLRALAEVENMRRRTESETAQARKYGHSGFARDLLGSLDNLSRAVEALPENRDGLDKATLNLVVGVEMVAKEMSEVMQRHGITRINPLGEKFDHDRHQAMFEVPTADAEPGVVVEVARPGWMLHDRLLSPAMVGVAKKPDGADTPDDAA